MSRTIHVGAMPAALTNLVAEKTTGTAAAGGMSFLDIALRETAKKWDGKDPQKLESDLKALQIKYDTDMESIRKGAAVDLALTKARARDTAIACAALNLDEVKLDKDGKVAGLDAQLETLKKDKAWLFEDAQQPESSGKPPYTPPEGGSPNTVTDMASALAEHYK